MKSLFLLILCIVTIYSCSPDKRDIKEIACSVEKCELIEKKSVHDDINPPKYKVYTDCGYYFFGYRKYEIGDTAILRLVKYD